MRTTLAALFLLTSVEASGVMWDHDLLLRTRQEVRSNASSPLRPALAALEGKAGEWATRAEQGKTFSVMTKPHAGPSGSKHDFMSLATYWWPNNTTKDGLPYVRYDGLVNPETFEYDSLPLSQMIFAVSNLSLAYFFTGNDRYCNASSAFVDTWFFNTATRMNPARGLEYAQVIRGKDQGRGIGIIDAKDLAFVIDSSLLLKGCAAWPEERHKTLLQWTSTYLTWLASSPHAHDEFNQSNNHGTWFDVQALSLSLHTGNTSWAAFLRRNALQRVDTQINGTGVMPLEVSRTRSMHYTWWNLMAFFELAHMDDQLFSYTSPNGGSLRRALDFVAPYATLQNRTAWPYEEITPFDHGKFFQIFRLASRVYNNASYEEAIRQLPGNVNYTTNVINLLWPPVF